MQIRPAHPDDHAALVDVWLRSVRATHKFLTEADVEALLPQVRDGALSGLDLWVLTAAEDDRPAGFVGTAGDKIEALFIAPEHHRRGGGRRLVEHVQARRPGPLRVDVNEQNPAARRFYEAMGFVVEGRSALDGEGRPFPLLHMRRAAPRAQPDIDERVTDDEARVVLAGVSAFSDLHAPPRNYRPVRLAVRDDAAHVVAGLLGSIVWDWLQVDVLWVDEPARGQGLGRALIARAEHLARAAGCRHARVDTFDFEARGFYENLGYRVYGQLDGFPAGHTHFHLRKDFDG